MGVLGTVLLVVFIIVCLLLVLLVAIQGDEENGMGGLLGGRGTAAFGSHSASVLTKTTCVLVVLFFLLSVGLAFVNKGNVGSDTVVSGATDTAEEAEVSDDTQAEKDVEWWNSDNQAVEETSETTEADAESTEAPAEDVVPAEAE